MGLFWEIRETIQNRKEVLRQHLLESNDQDTTNVCNLRSGGSPFAGTIHELTITPRLPVICYM